MAEVDDAQAFWDQRYRDPGYIFGKQPNEFLVSQARLLPQGARVLAVADGEGRNGVWLAERGCRVTSMDLSPIAIEKAKALARERAVDIEFFVADLMRWNSPEAVYDAVVCIFIQFATPRMRAKLFGGFHRALRPGGIVILEGYGLEQLQYSSGGPKEPENLYTLELLRDAFADWEILHLRERKVELDEGPKHRGMAALVDLVARKPA
ncbi:MAG TPA: class I SAM-dependent methyltransferase [Burkholderiales bacterium]|nr:class I SAM-dependent methyltransferase [Burkholderiales bacterium]